MSEGGNLNGEGTHGKKSLKKVLQAGVARPTPEAQQKPEQIFQS
jgi:hypothetical protein